MHDCDNETKIPLKINDQNYRQILSKNQNVNKRLSADWSKFTRENNQNKVLRSDWSVWNYAGK